MIEYFNTEKLLSHFDEITFHSYIIANFINFHFPTGKIISINEIQKDENVLLAK